MDLLPLESDVKLVGLSNAISTRASFDRGFDEEKKRYTVRRREGGKVAVRPINVRQVISGARIDIELALQEGASRAPPCTTHQRTLREAGPPCRAIISSQGEA